MLEKGAFFLRYLFLKNVAVKISLISEKKTIMSENMPERMSEHFLQSVFELSARVSAFVLAVVYKDA